MGGISEHVSVACFRMTGESLTKVQVNDLDIAVYDPSPPGEELPLVQCTWRTWSGPSEEHK